MVRVVLLLDAAEKVLAQGDTAGLKEVVHSLGLFDDRLKALTAITSTFLTGADAFAVDQAAHKIYGVGKFGEHSFRIFCRDEGATLRADDAALASFCGWRKREERRAGPDAAAQTAAKA